MKLYREVSAFRVNGKLAKIKERVVKDSEIHIIINGTISRRFYVTPSKLKEFTVGYLLGEGLIKKVSDIKLLDINRKTINVEINLEDASLSRESVIGSDSMGGWRYKIESVEHVDSTFSITKDEVFKAFNKLVKGARLWRMTGGAHVAALVCEGKFVLAEDVSRHVAVDKIIGAGALDKVDFARSFIVYSGRMPADMLIKVARAGIPIIASNAAPTYSGYKVATDAGLTMLGFVRDGRFNIYTNPERIKV
ncbi:MAG TPA: formate dehydrogenase accessory sulfurtransferase FdhD [Methanothermobacter sp.]|nr:protein FdhD homolog [Methanothermobacter sp. MT-2]HHW04969.1 formate dehydrogenase accessory sulfurtransferase FdhD [Methanothermobacter sp.]HOK72337.1 formate dehydrogenase accessory sulfurtransferase FdhD [Methanothermobacter sp.]HOL68861.1 formate dehydrogenase accessory sulfurtransferase FdhD [Methanothermobacter sp.]HPQ05309.1 formate dehydrogenase accessory sulfurtransferase FdhD [Methanothermobacter sp.]